MSCVVCATRGGEGSRAAKQLAIEEARARELPLVFLFVVHPAGLSDYNPSLGEAITRELEWVGRVLLGVGRQRAERQGVISETVVVEGDVRAEIQRFVVERSAALLVLGAPRGTTANVFGDDEIEREAESIAAATRVEVRVARPIE